VDFITLQQLYACYLVKPEMLNDDFLVLIGDLTIREKRSLASREVAALLGARDFLFFVKDPEIQVFIPALGYPQILKDSSRWQKFLSHCSRSLRLSDRLPWPDQQFSGENVSTVVGISANKNRTDDDDETSSCIMVFLDQPAPSEMLSQLINLLPLVESCIKLEWLSLEAQNSFYSHANEIKKYESLVMQLDKTRNELQHSLYRSQKALSSRNDFLSVASHELKTPLQSITLEVGMLKRSILKMDSSDLRSKSLERFESLDIHLKRIATLIDNLLDYSQVAKGELIFKLQKTNLSDLVSLVVRRYHRQASAANVQIHLNVQDGISVECDVSKIDQVISNLISNAIKYGSQKDIFVSVAASREGGMISVRDQGIGIPLREQQRIFERFERCDSAKNISGFGLGLFVVKQIVDGHKGWIEVQSEPSFGSTFTIHIPQTVTERDYAYETN
jgi:signal transduction histidine kinase